MTYSMLTAYANTSGFFIETQVSAMHIARH